MSSLGSRPVGAGSAVHVVTESPRLTLVNEGIAPVEHPLAALRWRRFGDVVIAGVTLVVAAVPMLLIAAAIKVTSRGPVLFRQDRVGREATMFRVAKFRTMTDGTHADVMASEEDRRRYIENDFKLDANDQRITKLGRLLRKTSLDELPQLFNVIKGEMSIVGIRPLVPIELGLRPDYDQELYRSLRPGLTGLWQVEGRSTVAQEERLELDRRYVETWSPWNDAKILLRTPLALVKIGHTS